MEKDLFIAARSGDIKKVVALLDQGVNIDAHDKGTRIQNMPTLMRHTTTIVF